MFSDLPLRILTQNICQEDWPDLLEESSARSQRHKCIADNLKRSLAHLRSEVYPRNAEFREKYSRDEKENN